MIRLTVAEAEAHRPKTCLAVLAKVDRYPITMIARYMPYVFPVVGEKSGLMALPPAMYRVARIRIAVMSRDVVFSSLHRCTY
jgi:hypothetical protein